MPTGYTSQIKDGISFNQFALSCARNFGAAIMLRDEPGDILPNIENVKCADIARRQRELDESIGELRSFLNKTQAEIHVDFVTNRLEQIKYLTDYLERRRELRAKYEKMLAEVRDWAVPTADHMGLKEFMIEQIESSIRFDCDEKYTLERLDEERNKHQADFYWERYAELNRNIQSCVEYMDRDSRADEKRSGWVKELIESLPKESPVWVG